MVGYIALCYIVISLIYLKEAIKFTFIINCNLAEMFMMLITI